MALPTLAERFDPRHNSLNALRLVLASSVIVSHSWVLSGHSDRAVGYGNQLVGDIGVDGFFAISGFLILGSRLASRSLIDFFWRRFLRIWPAFIVVLVFVAAVVAPVAAFALGSGTYNPASAAGYVLKNLSLVIFQPAIESTPAGIPVTDNWNAPLWTLAFEFVCYIGIALIVTVLPKRFLGAGLWVLLGAAIAANVATVFLAIDLLDPIVALARLGAFFVAGSLLRHYRDRIPMTTPIGIVAAVGSALLIWGQAFDVFGGPFFAVLLLWLGIVLPLQRVGHKNDISYGMYIYAFPLQLLLAIIVGSALQPWLFAIVSIAVTIPFAAGSWFAIERPAMTLKRLTATGRFSRAETATQEPAI